MRILLVEDDAADALIVKRQLRVEAAFTVDVATTLHDGIAMANATRYDVALLDLGLPDSGGVEKLRMYLAQTSGIPVVILTGLDDEGLASSALRTGAQDYLVKGRDDSVSRALRYAIERTRAQGRFENVTRSNEELERFAQVASHDLQAPLRQIATYAEDLQSDHAANLDPEGTRELGLIREGVTRMQELVRGILAYNRVESAEPKKEDVNMEALVADVQEMIRPDIIATHATVKVESLPVVRADRGQLTQVLQNLLGNAIKYRGPADPAIHISARREPSEWVFVVKDNGIGFDPSQAEHIFQVFTRLHGNEAAIGSGIGLAVSKRIVRKHGGRIWADSKPGVGSVFSFTLPVTDEGA